MISFVVAMSNDLVIGKDSKLPWHLPNDLKNFKTITEGNIIVMGRKTFESLGRVLPNRHHIVLTSGDNIEETDNVSVVRSTKELRNVIDGLVSDGTEVFIIGGGELFKEYMPYVDKIYATIINESFEGDTFFPYIYTKEWDIVAYQKGEKDEDNPYDYYFIEYVRKE